MVDAQAIASRLISDLMRDYGLTRDQAAGVAGNFAHETMGFTRIEESGSGNGLGYGMWTGARRTAFENYAREHDLGTDSYAANYGYLQHELDTDRYERRQFMRVTAATTPEEAARIVSENFLRPGTPHMDRRIDYATKFAQAVADPASAAPVPATPSLPLQSARLAQTAQDPALRAALDARVMPRPRPPHAPTANQAVNAINAAAPGQPAVPSAMGYAQPPGSVTALATPRPVRPDVLNLGDEIALSPVQGGRQVAPPFDAAFDTRVGAMRMLAQPEAVSSQGLGMGASPAPVALPRPRPSIPLTALTTGGRQPIGLVEPGNLDLNSRRVLTDGVGGYRTENSISIGTDRGEVLIPTVVNGKQLSEPDAIEHYQRTGENLGTFQTPQAADRYAETLHERQGQRYGNSLPAPVPQSNIERGKSTAPSLPWPRPPTAPPDPTSTSVQRVASANPARLPTILPSTLGQARTSTPQSQIERSTRTAAPPRLPRITVSTLYTTPQSSIERGAPRVASTIGQPPSTRVVQSVPMPALRPSIPQSFAGMEGGAPRVAAAEERLPSTPMVGRLAAPPTVVYDPSFSTAEVTGNKAQTIRPTGPLAPVPRSTIARAVIPAPPYREVATEIDVKRPVMPDLPRPRPDLGMGGVDIIPVVPTAAPAPMPRLDRPGVFGNPQLFGKGIKLPGVLGLIQDFTKRTANASGPFNNGVDNLAYNTMRGGDFNTPGAATGQAGGYRYAPRPSGGWLNVGRINPSISAAEDYARRNKRNEWNDDAAARVNGGGQYGGASRSIG